jgi:hypothetical protein
MAIVTVRAGFCDSDCDNGTGISLSLTPGPDVEHVAIACAEVVDPGQRRSVITAAALALDRHQRRLHIRLHLAAVAADIGNGALLNQIPDAILLLRDEVLHIGLRRIAAREGGV